MPSKTFLRLPEDKRARFMEAAWAEFSRVNYADTTINNIVKDAGISRGSFYQYFADKDDLFSYLLRDVREHFIEKYIRLLDAAQGDLFQAQLAAYDQLFQQRCDLPRITNYFIRVLQINPGMDLQTFLKESPDHTLMEALSSHVDVSRFRRQEPPFVSHVISLAALALGSSMADVLAHPEKRDICRQELRCRLEIIQSGALLTDAPANP